MMSNRFGKKNWMTALVAGVLILAMTENANAQFGTVNQIGGVYIDASGVLSEAPEQMQRATQQKVLDGLADVVEQHDGVLLVDPVLGAVLGGAPQHGAAGLTRHATMGLRDRRCRSQPRRAGDGVLDHADRAGCNSGALA